MAIYLAGTVRSNHCWVQFTWREKGDISVEIGLQYALFGYLTQRLPAVITALTQFHFAETGHLAQQKATKDHIS